MSEHIIPDTTTKAYEIKVVMVECIHDNIRKVIREENLGWFRSEKEAIDIFELMELPNHIITI